MRKLGLPDPQGLDLTVRDRAEAELETVRNLAVEAQERLERAKERWNLEYDRSIYANAEKGRKIGGLCALMDNIKEVMPEDAWTRRASDDADMTPASSRIS